MCRHSVQFYRDESFLVQRVVDELRPALTGGDGVVIIATPEHRAAFETALGKDLRDDPRVVVLDAWATLERFMVDGHPDEARFRATIGDVIDHAARMGNGRVSAYGEMVAVLCADHQADAALELEQMWNAQMDRQAFTLLCAYPLHAFPDEADGRIFQALCEAHSRVLPPQDLDTTDPRDLHRLIAILEQKAFALEREMDRRHESERMLNRLAVRQELIKENERKRIAREIHDELGGLLTGINACVSVQIEASRRAGAKPAAELLAASELVGAAIETVRRVICDLRPTVLDELGVWSALEWYARRLSTQTGLDCRCLIDESVASIRLDADRSIALFRIVQEALTNVLRHAEATCVWIRAAARDGHVTVEVEDNGRGITSPAVPGRESWGIIGMQERARHCGGHLRVTRGSVCGTLLAVSVPLAFACA